MSSFVKKLLFFLFEFFSEEYCFSYLVFNKKNMNML